MAKRRKLSDLTDQETATVVDLLKRFQLELDEHDDDDREVDLALQTVVRKFSELKYVPFSDATVLTLTHAHINVEALEWNSNGRSQAQHLGGKTTPDALSLDETKKQIRYIRKHIAFETEAGCRILINAIMLHAVTNLDTSTVGVAITPKFRAVDYLMALGTPSVRDNIVLSPQLAFTNSKIHQSLTCSIYEAKPEKTLTALPQAVMEAVIQFTTFRGCVTTGEEWLFFVYNKNKDGPGGVASYLPPIRLEHDLNGLSLVLGLLYDWIECGQQKTLKFCQYSC
ncbi:hypothetical protein BJ912DRAFT_1024534 [Pholiota molesta]|nr:hypothetical protein BJ912DRAFT_1024534 [Pholiota molesta]